MPHDVFISHSKDDRLTAYALCNKLESAGVRCWIGPRDVEPGVDWGAAIIEAIGGCRVMVLIFSLKANDSRHVHREVQRAFERNLTVIPFRVEDAEPTGTLEYYLGPVHWLDAITPPLEQHLETVAKRVKALLLPASVLESATQLAAESPPIPSQTTNQPAKLKLPAQLDASEAQSAPRGNLPLSTAPRPPPIPASSAPPTANLSVLWEKIVRNIEPVDISGLLLRRKEILISIVLLAVLSVITAGIFKDVGPRSDAFFVCLLALTVFQMCIFFRIGRGASANRWLPLLIVAIGAGLVLSGVYVLSGLGGFREWGFFVTGICLGMGSGGALSVFARSSGGKKSSLLSIVAVGAGLSFTVCFVLGLLWHITLKENVRPWEEEDYPRREGTGLRGR